MAAEWLRIGVGGVVPVVWNVSKAGADTGTGTLEGWASVFNVVDQQDDIVLPGAFRKTLQEWRSSGRTIPLVVDHEHSSDGVIGSLKSASETPYGLKFAATYSSVARAQEARQKAKEGHLTGLSIFGPIFKKSFEMRDGRELRLLHEVGLMEVSQTPFGANHRALVTAAKNGQEEIDDPLSDVWICDMKSALAITSPQVRKAAVDLLVRAQYPTVGDPAGTTGTAPAVPTTDPADQDPAGAAKYALGIIGEFGPDASPPDGEPSESLADQLLASIDATTNRTDLQALLAEVNALKGE